MRRDGNCRAASIIPQLARSQRPRGKILDEFFGDAMPVFQVRSL
jgi:hypothetical protein